MTNDPVQLTPGYLNRYFSVTTYFGKFPMNCWKDIGFAVKQVIHLWHSFLRMV